MGNISEVVASILQTITSPISKDPPARRSAKLYLHLNLQSRNLKTDCPSSNHAAPLRELGMRQIRLLFLAFVFVKLGRSTSIAETDTSLFFRVCRLECCRNSIVSYI